MSYIPNQHSLLADAFARGNSLDDLKNGLFMHVRAFVRTNMKILVAFEIPEKIILLGLKNNLPKQDLLLFVTIPFLDKPIFQAFRRSLPTKIVQLMDALIWDEEMSQQEIEKKLGIQVYTTLKSRQSGYEQITLKPEFSFFKYKNTNSYTWGKTADYTLYIEPSIRRIISIYYDAPKGSELEGIDKELDTDYQYLTGEVDVFLELPRLLAYVQQGNVKVSAKGKPQTSTLGKMQRKLNLKEFYPEAKEKSVHVLRTNLLAGLLTKLGKGISQAEPAVLIKTLVQSYYANKYLTVHGVLTYLKGTTSIDNYYTNNVERHFVHLLSELPTGEWISIKNILKNLKFNFLDVQPIKSYYAGNKVYYEYLSEVKYESYTYTENKHYVDAKRYEKAIAIPTVKGTFFLFAALGLLDVAYDNVDAEVMGYTCDSPYDGLQYVRLTPLGAYVAGKNLDYEAPEAVGKSTIVLSEDSLTIISDENDPTAKIILEPYTQKVSPNRFRTDAAIFLTGIADKTELLDKIELFEQTVTSELPENWQAFFKELEQKIDPLEIIDTIQIFKIPTDNPALIKLIARDAALKKLCFKAEGYHILVEKDKVGRFKARLREFGYLMSS